MARRRRQAKPAKKAARGARKAPAKRAAAKRPAKRRATAAPRGARRAAGRGAARPRAAGTSRRRAGSRSGAAAVPAEAAERPLRSARLTGGDVDADLERAGSTGEEAVGGSAATPDQDVVDELGDALGVGRGPGAEVVTSAEILEGRDRRRWRAERRQAEEPS